MSDREEFSTIKDEARRNVKRINPMGVQMQANTMRLFVQPGLDLLARENVPDARCGTCAARAGSVPAGCVVTQADFLKSIMEGSQFMCHSHIEGGEPTHVCHGWLAARVLMHGETMEAPWPWAIDAGAVESEPIQSHVSGDVTGRGLTSENAEGTSGMGDGQVQKKEGTA